MYVLIVRLYVYICVCVLFVCLYVCIFVYLYGNMVFYICMFAYQARAERMRMRMHECLYIHLPCNEDLL